MILRGQDDERRDRPTKGIDSLNYSRPFAVARLGELCPAKAIRGCDYHARRDDAHHEPGLIEVVDIVIQDTVLSYHIPHKRKPVADDLWILALSPLVVVSTYTTHLEPFVAFDKVVRPELADRGYVAYA